MARPTQNLTPSAARPAARAGLPVGSVVFFLLALLLGLYFAFAAVQGPSGILRRVQLEAETADLVAERDRLTAQVAEMRKTAAPGDVTPDIALLEELTRLGQRRKALEEVRRLREAYPDNAALAAFEE